MLVLGIESSCDETSVAVLDNQTIIANTIYTQQEHAEYGGVVPEIASRAHIRKIDVLCSKTLHDVSISADQIELIAVTDRPGLAGALLVGISFGLGMHCAYGIPIIGVNHLEGHICSALLQYPEIEYPFLALVASGGHTALYQVNEIGSYFCLGQTIDDAAGEAFDKVGKMLGFAYPAGRSIQQEALKFAGGTAVDFPVGRVESPHLDFSFSGLKTAVRYHIESQPQPLCESDRVRICYSFQETVVTSLIRQACAARQRTGIPRLALVGGVACNSRLREAVKAEFKEYAFVPAPHLCTDNAAMIAKAGMENYIRGNRRHPHMEPSISL